MKKDNIAVNDHQTKGNDWKKFLLLAFVGLPIITFLAIGAYGFVIWFMQLLFWGPPS